MPAPASSLRYGLLLDLSIDGQPCVYPMARAAEVSAAARYLQRTRPEYRFAVRTRCPDDRHCSVYRVALKNGE